MLSRLLRPLAAAAPRISPTERAALEAGDVWADGELFSGRPDFRRLLAEPYPELTATERDFLAGPVERICETVDPWELDRRREIPPEVWQALRDDGFFGLVLPREWGGLGFSSLAASAVFGKLATRSLALSAVVLIPNSVGPGELLLEYGTRAQRERWLPRLATGEEIPCFALTEPEAGSDAAALASRGVVFARGGDPWLRLDFDKRYITLAPVASLIGLAFCLEDPDGLLGDDPRPGITVALVPAATPGVEIGLRHDPMGIPFPNGPVRGRGVEVPLDAVIGGASGAGRGWRMLMEALSGGRAISLPAQAAAGAKGVARAIGAYAAVRRQFGLPIARFEGVAEPLARIAGHAYLMEAARVFTCGAVDSGRRPAVVSAMVKVRQTEMMRQVARDAMDVAGGAGICFGPRNLLGRAWLATPIGITVEGANILTRTLITFGQGALRCHPWARRELEALERGDGRRLGRALLGHAGHVAANACRVAVLGATRGRAARSPVAGPAARPFRRLAWASARFALLADLAMITLGGELKRRGHLSGRLADALSWMYLVLAALRRFEAEGRREADRPLVEWAAGHGLAEVDRALTAAAENFPGRFPGPLLRGPVAFWWRLLPLARPPSDRLADRVAAALGEPGELRDRLTAGVFVPTDPESPARRLEEALELAHRAEPLRGRLRRWQGDAELPDDADPVAAAREAGVLDEEEAHLVRGADEARRRVIEVDEFDREEYLAR